jgi:hypothetical protein
LVSPTANPAWLSGVDVLVVGVAAVIWEKSALPPGLNPTVPFAGLGGDILLAGLTAVRGVLGGAGCR